MACFSRNKFFLIFISKQEGGCSAPVAAHAELEDGNLSILAGVWSLDGSEQRIERIKVDPVSFLNRINCSFISSLFSVVQFKYIIKLKIYQHLNQLWNHSIKQLIVFWNFSGVVVRLSESVRPPFFLIRPSSVRRRIGTFVRNVVRRKVRNWSGEKVIGRRSRRNSSPSKTWKSGHAHIDAHRGGGWGGKRVIIQNPPKIFSKNLTIKMQ